MRELNSMRTCPYYRYERKAKDGTVWLYCENLRIKFPTKMCRRLIVYGFCANGGFQNGKECPWHREMEQFYSGAGIVKTEQQNKR